MMRYLALCVVTAVLVIGGATAWQWHAARGEVAPLTTAASLSIAGPSFSSREQAAAYAAAIESAGQPAFVRLRVEERRYQVLVGPFVSSEEAQVAQRALARRGLADTRLMVDASLRTDRPAPAPWPWQRADLRPVIVAAAAPGMLSVAIETGEAPREVLAERIGRNLLEIQVIPAPPGMAASRWDAPEGTLLLERVDLAAAADGSDRMRLRLQIPPEAISRVRLEGRRVYIDLAWPDPPWPLAGGPRLMRARTAARVEPDVHRREQILDDAITRFRQVEPFLLSAVDAPEPQVLEALGRTLEAFPDALPAEVSQAIAMAREAAAPGFTGDRALHARRAVALFESAAGEAIFSSQ